MKKLYKGLLVLASLSCISVGTILTVNADSVVAEPTATEFYMNDKVQVRTVAGDIGCGIRFETLVKQSYFDAVNDAKKEDTAVVYGTLIAPVEVSALDFSTPAVSNIEVENFNTSTKTVEISGETYKYFYADIIFDETVCAGFTQEDWLTAYSLDLSAKSYVKYTDQDGAEKTVFAENGQTRSVFDASENVLLKDALTDALFEAPELEEQKAVLTKFLQVEEAVVPVVENTTTSYLECEWIDYKQVSEYSGNDYIQYCRAFPTTDAEKLVDTKKIKVDGAANGLYNAYINGTYYGGVEVENEVITLGEIPDGLTLGTTYTLVIKNATNAYAQEFVYVTEAINTAEELLNVMNSYHTANLPALSDLMSDHTDALMLYQNGDSYEFRQRYYVLTADITVTKDQCRYGWSNVVLSTGTDGVTNSNYKGAQLYDRKTTGGIRVSFYDVLDGNGHSLTFGQVYTSGVFGQITNGAVIKNVNISVGQVNNPNNYKGILAYTLKDSTLKNMCFEYTVTSDNKYVNSLAYDGSNYVIKDVFVKVNGSFSVDATIQSGVLGGLFDTTKGTLKQADGTENIVIVSSAVQFLYKGATNASSQYIVYASNDKDKITVPDAADAQTIAYETKVARYDTEEAFVGDSNGYQKVGSWKISADGTREYESEVNEVDSTITEATGVEKYSASVSATTLTENDTATISILEGAIPATVKYMTAVSTEGIISISENTITAVAKGEVELKVAYQVGGTVKVQTFTITVNAAA